MADRNTIIKHIKEYEQKAIPKTNNAIFLIIINYIRKAHIYTMCFYSISNFSSSSIFTLLIESNLFVIFSVVL